MFDTNTTKKIKNHLVNNGFKVLNLNSELKKLQNSELNHQQKCERINSLEFNYSQVRCSSPSLLREVLGLKFESVVEVGLAFLMSQPKEKVGSFLIESIFDISEIDNGDVVDFGFFTNKDAKDIMGQNEIKKSPLAIML